jgi:DNA-binding response OmpR family regulator
MRLLLAEDEPTTRCVLESLLVTWGYEVESVADGTEAFACFQRPSPPRLALLDWMMPGMEGVELCRKVRDMGLMPPPYLILLTSRTRKPDVVEGLRAGANDYLAKPCNNEELQARLAIGKRMVELQTTLADRVKELQDALSHIKRLQGILPICMHCHRIRTDQASWQRIEKYISEHSEATFSHDLCPECLQTHYSQYTQHVKPPGTT